eukprot:gene28956-34946_t
MLSISVFVYLPLSLLLCSLSRLEGQLQALDPLHSRGHVGTVSRQHLHKPRNIYIDLGANDGSSITTFMGQASRQSIETDGSEAVSGGVAKLREGSLPNTLWHIVAVEGNFQHDAKLLRMQQSMLKHPNVSSFSLYNATAVLDRDGTIDFIWDGLHGGSAGSTAMGESFSAIGRNHTIPAIDIVSLFHRERIHPDDFVVVKMDIEGAEYSVVRRVLLSHLWRFIDKHHTAFFVFGHPGEDKTAKNYNKRLAVHEKYLKQYEALMWMMEGLEPGSMQLFSWGR